MLDLQLFEQCQWFTMLPAGTGSTARSGVRLDLSPFNSALIMLEIETVAAGASHQLFLEHSDTIIGPDETVAGSAVPYSAANANSVMVLEVYRPLKRYIRPQITKDGTNNSTESVRVMLFNSGRSPVVKANSVSFLLRPESGTP